MPCIWLTVFGQIIFLACPRNGENVVISQSIITFDWDAQNQALETSI